MSLSRRDTIIIAVLINAGLLAILFATAINTDDETLAKQTSQPIHAVTEMAATQQVAYVPESLAPRSAVRDEIDQVLEKRQQQTTQKSKVVQVEEKNETKVVNVTVKSGDYLDKIAHANATSVEDIIKVNNLSSTRLKVGQVLRVPVGTVTAKESSSSIEKKSAGSQYYLVQSGDNPWTIARKNGVKFDDLLLLNGLNEETARNLKIGQKLRIR